MTKKKKIIIIAITVLLLLIIGIIVFLMVKPDDKKDNDNKTTAEINTNSDASTEITEDSSTEDDKTTEDDKKTTEDDANTTEENEIVKPGSTESAGNNHQNTGSQNTTGNTENGNTQQQTPTTQQPSTQTPQTTQAPTTQAPTTTETQLSDCDRFGHLWEEYGANETHTVEYPVYNERYYDVCNQCGTRFYAGPNINEEIDNHMRAESCWSHSGSFIEQTLDHYETETYTEFVVYGYQCSRCGLKRPN